MPENHTSLSITVNGVTFENPFLLGSGPPTTHAGVIAKSFDLGWGGAVAKTIAMDHTKIHNVVPRYGKIRARETGQVVGFENIELISDRPFATWLEEFRTLKKKYPRKVLVASIMEEYSKEAWQEITRRVVETGVDILELNLSCPHGLPERKMGMAMGEHPDLVREVTGWVKEVSTIPVWVKTTPNVGNVTAGPQAALAAKADGISTINTILSVIGVDLKTLRPMPTVNGYSEPGGYSGIAVRPIALRHIMEISRTFPNVALCGIGGIETGSDAAQFLLLGASTVQICTGVMLNGYGIIDALKRELSEFMQQHGFKSVGEFIGKSRPYFTTHAHLVESQIAKKRPGSHDDHWNENISAGTDAKTFEA